MADQLIGRYKIEGLLGRGAMGVVYKAYDPILDRYAAIKVMSTSGELDDELRARFFREARSAARLSNPNIISIYDMGEDQARPFIAMEYVEGEDLRQLIKHRVFVPFEKKIRFMIQVCQALAYAHLHGVVHRDIKPGNIRITRLGEVKILDFGLARLESSEMTRTGMLMGTPYYMSPEQAKGAREIDGRSDLFSVGVILYELLSYRRPFEGETPATVCFQIIREPHAPLSTHLPGCDTELQSIIDRALAKEPADRFDDCGQMGTALGRFLEVLPSRRAALLESIGKVETAIETAMQEAGITDRAGLEQIAQNEATFTRPTESSPGGSEQSTVVTPAQSEDYGSLLVRLAAANKQLDALKDNVDKFHVFENACRATKELFAKGEWQACLDSLESLEAQFPVTPELLSMRSVCREELAKAEAHRQKQAQLKGVLKEAKTAWERGNLQACTKACNTALDIDPDCQEAAELKRRVADRQEKSRRVSELESTAHEAWKRRDYQACAKAAEEALDLDPGNEALGALRLRARQALDRQEQADRLLKLVREQLEGKQYPAAIGSIDQLRGLGVDADLISTLDAEARLGQERESRLQGIARMREKAAALAARGNHREAIAVCEEGLATDPEDAGLKALLQESRALLERQAQIEELLAEAEANLSARNWQAALEAAQLVLGLDGANEKAKEWKRRATDEIQRAETVAAVRERARVARGRKSWSEAEGLASEGLRLEPNDSEFLEIRAEAAAEIDKLKKQTATLAEAAQKLKSDKWDSAIALADQVLALDPANPEAGAIRQTAQRAIEEARRRAEAEKQKAIESARSTARTHLQKGDYAKVIEVCAQALAGPAASDKTLEELREKAERALRERAEKLESELNRARKHLAAGRIAEANEAISNARQIDPRAEAIAQLEQDAARAQAEIDRRKKLLKLVAAARAAKEKAAADECSRLAREALALVSSASQVDSAEQRELQQMAGWASTVLEAERAERERREKIATSWKAARSAIQRGKHRTAVRNLDVVLRLDQGDREAEKARQEALAAATIQRGKRLKVASYAAAAILSLSVAVFGILPVVSTNEKEAAEAPLQQSATVTSPQQPIDIPPSPKPPVEKDEPAEPPPAKDETAPRVSQLLEEASRSLKAKDFAAASRQAREVLDISGDNSEARRIQQAAEKSLEEIASAKREARSLIAGGKPDQALQRLNTVLQLAPGDSEAAELAARLNNLAAAKTVADKARTQTRQAKAQAQTSAADFPNLLERANRIEAEAGSLYENNRFGEATAKFNEATDAFESAGQQAADRIQQSRLEAAKQPAVQAQQGFDQSRAKALSAGADQFAADRLRQADAKAADGRRKLLANDFAGAQQDFRSAISLADDAAAAALKAQESRRAETEKRDLILGQAKTSAEQMRRRLEAAKATVRSEDAEAAAEEAKGVSFFEQGIFDQAAVAFERSLKRYQSLSQDYESVRGVVSAFSKAYSSRDLQALKAIWPGMDSETEQGFKETFAATRALDLNLQASQIDIHQNSAVATGTGRLRVTPINGKPLERESSTVRFQLARNGASWAIQSYRFSSAAR